MSLALDYLTSLDMSSLASDEYEDLLSYIVSSTLSFNPQQRKAFQNHVGKMMELLCAEELGFEHLNIEGADIVNREKGVLAEIKNRHNTMNGGSKKRLIRVMKNLTLTDEFRGYDKYIIIIHPKVAGYERNIGQAITEISASKFFNKYNVSFRDAYIRLLDEVATLYGVETPNLTTYYEDVVFPTRKKRKG